MNEVVINNCKVGFEVAGSQTFTTSLDIASVFEKRHDNIIAQIRAFPNDDFNALNFKAVNYKDSKGELRPMYKITDKGFSLLAMSFSGAKFYRFKVEFLEAFEALKKDFAIGKVQFYQTLDALKQKSSEADAFRQKYYNAIERENELLRQKQTPQSRLFIQAF